MPTKSTEAREKLPRHEITIKSKQRLARLNTGAIKRFVAEALTDKVFHNYSFSVGICIVDAKEITRLNETYLQHEGSTDIITFDYSEGHNPIEGDIYISVADALEFARQYKTTLDSELARYCIHGLLHLIGFDDKKPELRRKMKMEENRLVKLFARPPVLKEFQKD